MKANELRIGNYITLNNPKNYPYEFGKVFEVVKIDTTDQRDVVAINSINRNENIVIPLYSQFIEYIKSIPITEDWLKDFGFEKTSENNFVNEFIIMKNISGNFVHSLMHNYRKIYYVHQLQNLYFALTEKELIKK